MNLERDNPLDAKNNANMQEGVALKFDDYSVYSDNNNDGVINKGETVLLNVSLKNTGVNTAECVKATFSTNSSFVSNLTPTTEVTYGMIEANSVEWYSGYENYYVLQFTVSNDTPANTTIPISISIVDESGNTWSSSFNIMVQ
jgi:hypothetical protein